MELSVLVLLLAAVTCGSAENLEEFKEKYIWRTLDFAWPDDTSRAEALRREQYQPENNALSGIKVWQDRIYLTLPRWKRGVPATLVSIPAAGNETSSPRLEPFPSWDMQIVGNCSALQFVQSIEIDTMGQMWVLDSGRLYTMTESPDTRCRPKLVLIHLENSVPKVLQTFQLPDSVLSRANDSLLVDLVLDTDATVYISDASPTDPGIIVFNTWNAQAWKVSDATMQADPTWHGMVAGKEVRLSTSINAMALSPIPPGASTTPVSNRTLYYAPLSSDRLYAISTHTLRNQQVHHNIRSFISDLGNKTSFSQGMMVDSHGVMYLGLNSMDAIARWDTRKLPLQTNLHVITKDSTRMQWPSTFAIDRNGSLWVISNKLQNLMAGTVNTDDYNYRVMRAVTNTRSYLYPEDRPIEVALPEPSPPMDHHTDHSHHENHTHRPESHNNNSSSSKRNAAESVARSTSVVLTILTSIMTFILTVS